MSEGTPRTDLVGQTNEAQAQFEFRTTDHELFRDLALKMRVVGLVLVLVGVVNIVAAFVLAYRADWLAIRVGPIVMGIFALLIGSWTRGAANEFHQIASTSGRDMSHLMKALYDLLKLYSLQFWLIVVSLLVLLALVIYAVLVGTVAGGGPVFSY